MSGKTIIKQKQRDNALEALNVMWPSVPPRNVSKDLRQYVRGTGDRMVTSFGGWCGRWPNFRAQGIVLCMGQPITVKYGSGASASMLLFGIGGMFLPRGNLPPDRLLPKCTDHEIVTARLKWLIAHTEVL